MTNKLEQQRMYKTLVAFVIVVHISTVHSETRRTNRYIERIASVPIDDSHALDWCPQCINTFDDVIDAVLDIVLQYGILNSCGELCSLVTDKTGSTFLGFVCMAGCDVLGINEFVKIIDKVDIDPIYYCEQIQACPGR
jgi:hypothetical protein